MTDPVRRTFLRRLEQALFGFASLCLGAYVLVQGESFVYQGLQSFRLERALREGPVALGPSRAFAAEPAAVEPPRSRPLQQPEAPVAAPADLIGRLEAPRLRLRIMVAEGIDRHTLRRAAGHVPGTARPGEDGNVALAGHRDSVFRRLESVRPGDRLRMVTTDGAYEYAVEWAEVVEPDRGDLLGPTADKTLTLVTCYPFSMVGPAPQRFVVRARQVAEPEQRPSSVQGPPT